jgi:catechol 2,3-dioxygenase-like lactoylglutathione lyase family enzyme
MALVTGIDHLIIAVHDLGAAARFSDQALGLRVSGGGTHPAYGTENRIIVLRDEYVELLGAQPGRVPTGLVGGAIGKGEGLAACILSVADPVAAAVALTSNGIAVDGPFRGTLDAGPDFTRNWSTVVPVSPTLPGIPFLISHESEGQERRRLLAGVEGLGLHALGAAFVASVTFAVRDLARSVELYGRVLDLAPGDLFDDLMLQATCARLTLPSGADLVLAAPMQAEIGPIAGTLRDPGEGIFSCTLAVDDLPAAVKMLRGRGIGVRVDEPDGVLVAAQVSHHNLLKTRIGLVSAT